MIVKLGVLKLMKVGKNAIYSQAYEFAITKEAVNLNVDVLSCQTDKISTSPDCSVRHWITMRIVVKHPNRCPGRIRGLKVINNRPYEKTSATIIRHSLYV